MEHGIIRLNSTATYPFNNSAQIVALKTEQSGTDYSVLTELIASDGAVGEIRVDAKAVNGFRISYSGSASFAELRYTIVEG